MAVSSPDAVGRSPETVAAADDGEFSKVIKETGKVSQNIENKEKNILIRQDSAGDESAGQANPQANLTQLEVTVSAGYGLVPVERGVLEASRQIPAAEASAAAQPLSAALTAEIAPAAESFRSDGRILPAPEALPALQRSGVQSGLPDPAVSTINASDRSALTQAASNQHVDAASKMVSNPSSLPADATLSVAASEKSEQPPTLAIRTSNTSPKSDVAAVSRTAVAEGRGTIPEAQAVINSAAGSKAETSLLAVPGTGEVKTPTGADSAGAELQLGDKVRRISGGPLNPEMSRDSVASSQRELAMTVPKASTSSDESSIGLSSNTRPDGAERQLPAGVTTSTLAARLNQLNAAIRSSVEESAQQLPANTTKIEQLPSAAASAVMAAPVTGLQKAEANLLSVRTATRERTPRSDGRGMEGQLGISGSVPVTSNGSDAIRVDSAIVRGESAAALAQLPAALARQVLRSHAQNVSELRLQLKPEELGSLELKLRVDGDRVHVAMLTAQPGVKELLEAQLPQLRQLLEQGGLQLGDVDVAQRDTDGNTSRHDEQITSRDGARSVDIESHAESAASPRHQPKGLIDAFV